MVSSESLLKLTEVFHRALSQAQCSSPLWLMTSMLSIQTQTCLLGWCLLIQRHFCVVLDMQEKQISRSVTEIQKENQDN